jgi:tetratricopeptide (TPR) repeat protein
MLKETPAAGVYLVVDLTGDPLEPDLEALAKTPHVVLSAVSSNPGLSVAPAVAKGLSRTSLTAGQFLDLLRPVAVNKTAFLSAQQPTSVLFAPRTEVAKVAPPSVDPPKPPPAKVEEKVAETPPITPPPVKQAPTEAETRAANLQAAISHARTAREQQHWSEAIDNCKSALAIDSGSAAASEILWASFRGETIPEVRAHKWDEVKKSVEGAAAVQPNDPKLQDFRREMAALVAAEGAGSLKESKWAEADGEFKLAIFIRPSPEASKGMASADLHITYEAGLDAFRRQQFAAARDKMDAVLKLQSQFADQKDLAPLFADAKLKSKQANTEVVLSGAIKQFNSGDYETARATCVQVLGADPQNSGALALLERLSRTKDIEASVQSGQAKFQGRDFQGALQDFDMALRMNPNDARALAGRQQVQHATEQRQRNTMLAGAGIGIPAFALVVVLAPTARRARVFARLGWNARAIRLLEHILQNNPGRTEALVSLFELYSASGNRHAAIDLCIRYLTIKPTDPRVLMMLAEAQLEARDFEAARSTYRRVLTFDKTNEVACSRLLEMEDLPVREDLSALEMYEAALRANPASGSLNRLVAGYYLKQGRRSPQTLEVFQRALEAGPPSADLEMACAEVLRDRGQFEEVLPLARKVLDRIPDNQQATSLFLEASKACGRMADAFSILDREGLSAIRAVYISEEIATLDPALRPGVHQRYLKATGRERELCLAHASIDDGSMDSALAHLHRAIDESDPDPAYEHELVRLLRRFLAAQRETEGYPQQYAELIFKLGELERKASHPRTALAAFEEIVKLPEWMLRSTAVMQDILDSLPVQELATIFFEEVGWSPRPPTTTGTGIADLLVDPPADGKSSLFGLFEDCKVRCFSRPITLDDVVQLKRDLGEQDTVNREFTFVVSPLRARQDVLALIYALLTEQPSLRVIPLEAIALKQAIIEGKSPDVLEQLLRLWVGQGDLFDVHSPIADAGTFFGRGQFIHALTNKIIHGENFGIFGLRKVGKTSLVFQLRENLPKNLIGYADLQSISSRRCEEIYFRLSAALRREMRIKYPDIPPIPSRLSTFDAGQSYPTVATDFHEELLDIKRALESVGQQLRVLLLLDEIELLLPTVQNKGFAGYEDFFRQVRGLYQQEGFVLSGVVGADPNACRAGKWGDGDNPIFQYYDEIFLSPLDRTECDQMVQGIGEVMGVSFDAPSLSLIYDESGGHPYVARQLCSRIVGRHTHRPFSVTTEIVEEGVDDYIAQRPDYFIGVFRGYITNEARQFLEVAASKDENEVSHAELLAFAVKAGLERGQFDRALQDLELFHLVSREKDRYRIKIRLLRRWIRRSWLGIE